jgi:hypothetical protein
VSKLFKSMIHFVFEVTEFCTVVGYDIYDHRKQIVNYGIKEGFYLAFYCDKYFKDLEEDLIYFLYNNKCLMIRKKIALERKV